MTPSGDFVSSTDVKFGGKPDAGSLSLPCSSHFMFDRVTDQLVAAIPSLGSRMPGSNFSTSGSVGIYSKSNRLVSVVEVASLLWRQGHQHPHDAIFLPNGDLVVCCYGGACGGKSSSACQRSQDPHVEGSSAGTISYWKRVRKPPQPRPRHVQSRAATFW